MAVFDDKSRNWVASELPWRPRQNAGTVLGNVAGRGLGLFAVCAETCPEDEEGAIAKLHVARVAEDSTLVPIDIDGVDTREIPVASRIDLISSGSNAKAVFAIRSADTTLLISADPQGATAEALEGSFAEICSTDGGFVAVEEVPDGTPGAASLAVPPGALAPTVKPPALRVVAGPNPTEMKPIELPGEVKAALGDRLNQVPVCMPDGLAILGARQAWEVRNGAWTATDIVPAITSPVYGTGHYTTTLPGDRLLSFTSAGTFQREPRGPWRKLPDTDRPVRLGNRTVPYRVEEAPGGSDAG